MLVDKDNYEEVQRLTEIFDKRNDVEYAWVKQVIIVISAILGLIISLKGDDSETKIEHVYLSLQFYQMHFVSSSD